MMNIRYCSAVAAILVSAAAAAPIGDADRRTAVESFAGTWEIVVARPEGITKDARKLVFRKDLSYAALDKDDRELWAGTYELDPTASPPIWDHRSHEAKKKGDDVLGVYHLEGDALKLACTTGTWKDKTWTGKPRPTEFALPAADVVLELRRVSP